jgi:hypothetical protein
MSTDPEPAISTLLPKTVSPVELSRTLKMEKVPMFVASIVPPVTMIVPVPAGLPAATVVCSSNLAAWPTAIVPV